MKLIQMPEITPETRMIFIDTKSIPPQPIKTPEDAIDDTIEVRNIFYHDAIFVEQMENKTYEKTNQTKKEQR